MRTSSVLLSSLLTGDDKLNSPLDYHEKNNNTIMAGTKQGQCVVVWVVKVFSGAGAWGLAMLFLAAFHTCSVGLWSGRRVGQGPDVAKPGVIRTTAVFL